MPSTTNRFWDLPKPSFSRLFTVPVRVPDMGEAPAFEDLGLYKIGDLERPLDLDLDLFSPAKRNGAFS